MKLSKYIIFTCAWLALVLCCSMQAHAALEIRGIDSLGYQLIYDTDRNITWYDYTNANDNWQNQMDWAGSLDINFGGNHYADWRLPRSQDCAGTNCIYGEMGHLYYTDLGNIAIPTPGYGLSNTGDFQNLQARIYWSSYLIPNSDNAQHFDFSSGDQKTTQKYFDDPGYAGLAVRDGDVSMAIVPEPFSSLLFLIGGATLIGRKYIRRKKIV